jgi:uncharacterized membrane protein
MNLTKKRLQKTIIIIVIFVLIFGVLFVLQEKYNFLENFKNVYYSKSIIRNDAQVALKIVRDDNK